MPSARQQLLAALADELQDLEQRKLCRSLTVLDGIDGPRVQVDGSWFINWCSNDYLGLSAHPAVIEAAAKAASSWGVGARASRLLAGTTRWHQRLEDGLAAWFGAEAAMVYSTGYLANLGIFSALLCSQDLILIDRLAHASLIDAARLSRATLRVFRHNDPAHVAALLKRAGRGGRRFIVTEGVFSMDGDRAPLAALVEVAESHGAILYLDDAHGAFMLGARGRGSPEAAQVSCDRLLYMGTLGKALGCQGGFVVGSRPLIKYLRNRSRAFIYTTAPAVPVIAAATEALRLVGDEPQRRAQLGNRVERLYQRLRRLQAVPSLPQRPSHIMPIRVGQTLQALQLARQLWDRGIWAPAIRPPTVPEGTARLRLSVTALHTDAHIDALAAALREALCATNKRCVV